MVFIRFQLVVISDKPQPVDLIEGRRFEVVSIEPLKGGMPRVVVACTHHGHVLLPA